MKRNPIIVLALCTLILTVISGCWLQKASDTWRDSKSGLTWVALPTGGLMDFPNAIQHCESLKIGGFDDWRLPTISELRSLTRGCEALEKNGECPVSDLCNSQSCYNLEKCYCSTDKKGPGRDNWYMPSDIFGGSQGQGTFWSSTEYLDQWDHKVGKVYVLNFLLPELFYSNYDNSFAARCVRP